MQMHVFDSFALCMNVFAALEGLPMRDFLDVECGGSYARVRFCRLSSGVGGVVNM